MQRYSVQNLRRGGRDQFLGSRPRLYTLMAAEPVRSLKSFDSELL